MKKPSVKIFFRPITLSGRRIYEVFHGVGGRLGGVRRNLMKKEAKSWASKVLITRKYLKVMRERLKVLIFSGVDA